MNLYISGRPAHPNLWIEIDGVKLRVQHWTVKLLMLLATAKKVDPENGWIHKERLGGVDYCSKYLYRARKEIGYQFWETKPGGGGFYRMLSSINTEVGEWMSVFPDEFIKKLAIEVWKVGDEDAENSQKTESETM